MIPISIRQLISTINGKYIAKKIDYVDFVVYSYWVFDCEYFVASLLRGYEDMAADGIDSDCDGAELCYTDYDGDGFRPDDYSEVEGDLLCTGAGLVGADAPAGDCDDDDAAINLSLIHI